MKWEPEEERFINKIKRSPTQRQIDEIRNRCEGELKRAMRAFVGKVSNELNQRTIDYLTQQILTKYNNELEERGFTYKIGIKFSHKEPGDD